MALKILIVDDEFIIRDGINRKINRLVPSAIVVGQAQDAIEGLEIVKSSRPNVIITDIRMPEIDGLQFISKVKEIDIDIKFIVISGFQDFEYARSALRLGVEDYLLKPIDNYLLVEILEKLDKQIQDQNNNEEKINTLKKNATKGISFLKNKYLTDLLEQNNTTDATHILKNLEILDITFPFNMFLVINISVTRLECMELFPGKENFNLAKFAIRNIADEILAPLGMVISFEYLRDEKQLIFIINYDNDNACHQISDIEKLCNKTLHAINKYLKIDITIGIGSKCSDIDYLYKSYLDSYASVTQKFVIGGNKVINIKDVLNTSKIVYFLPEDSKLLLVNYIKQGNTKRIIDIIEKVFCSISDANMSYSNIKILYIDMLMIFHKTVRDIGGNWENIFSEDIFSENYISQYVTLDELLDWIRQCVILICNYIADLRKSHGRKVIEEIKDFINNYYYTDISLNDLSVKYYLNSNYLSQLFKNETGDTFINYLTWVRMEKAKELLHNTDVAAYKISEMVGYNNPRYFSEVFQKYYKCTPKEYREKSGVRI